MALAQVSLDDRYAVERGTVLLTGIQALVRLPILQRQRDLVAGLNTAGFVSGYRGSPLGGLDQALWRAKKQLEQHHVRFHPGLNEDLALTSVWGTQQANLDIALADAQNLRRLAYAQAFDVPEHEYHAVFVIQFAESLVDKLADFAILDQALRVISPARDVFWMGQRRTILLFVHQCI
mgnify:CR=1 FL=1